MTRARLISTPGLYDIPAEAYHNDPVVEPSLNASTIKRILAESPLHAAAYHPRLTLTPIREDKAAFDLGHACHTLLLGDGRGFKIVQADDWRTKAAKEAKAEARAEGLIPILAEQYQRVEKMVVRCREQLAQSEAAGAFDLSLGQSEQTVIWKEGSSWCRAQVDWMPNDLSDGSYIYDLKSTASASPEAWSRLAWNQQIDVQASWYARGLASVLGVEVRMRFVVAEVSEPHGVSVIELTPGALALADRKIARALAIWEQCLDRGVWPGYGGRVFHIETPPWHEARWLERDERDPIDEHMVDRLVDWHRPLEEVT